jgi:hypothetical protein
MADFSRIWKQAAASRKPEAGETTSTGLTDGTSRLWQFPVNESPVFGYPGSFANKVFFNPEEFRPPSTSLFNTSRGLEVQGEGYKIVDRRAPRTDFVERIHA